MELEVSINRYKPGRKFNWSQRNWTPKKSIGFFFREKDGCVFFWKRVWWSRHIWGRLEIWWNKKKSCCCCCFVSNVLFISSSLFMACLRSRDSNENLYSSQHRPQQQQQHQQQTTKRQQQSIKNSSCPLVTDVVVVVPAVVDSQQNRSITQVLFLLNCIYRISVWLKRRRIFHTRKSMCVAGWLYFRLRNDECVFFVFFKNEVQFWNYFSVRYVMLFDWWLICWPRVSTQQRRA